MARRDQEANDSPYMLGQQGQRERVKIFLRHCNKPLAAFDKKLNQLGKVIGHSGVDLSK